MGVSCNSIPSFGMGSENLISTPLVFFLVFGPFYSLDRSRSEGPFKSLDSATSSILQQQRIACPSQPNPNIWFYVTPRDSLDCQHSKPLGIQKLTEKASLESFADDSNLQQRRAVMKFGR